jgi:hypothetical protein
LFDAFNAGGGEKSPPEYIASKKNITRPGHYPPLRVEIDQNRYFVTKEKEKKDDITT